MCTCARAAEKYTMKKLHLCVDANECVRMTSELVPSLDARSQRTLAFWRSIISEVDFSLLSALMYCFFLRPLSVYIIRMKVIARGDSSS